MIRIYVLVAHFSRGKYETVSYYLDPARATDAALSMARSLCKDSYLLVQQLDVFPDTYHRSHLLRVDGEK